MNWSLKDIEKLQQAGKIKGYAFTIKEKNISSADVHAPEKGRTVTKHFPKASKEKDFIARNLLEWCQVNSLTLQEELTFHPDRRWRFDWAVTGKNLQIAVEYEGIMKGKSRHTTTGGFIADTQKYNAAAGLGWRVLRFTANNYTELLTELNKFL